MKSANQARTISDFDCCLNLRSRHALRSGLRVLGASRKRS